MTSYDAVMVVALVVLVAVLALSLIEYANRGGVRTWRGKGRARRG